MCLIAANGNVIVGGICVFISFCYFFMINNIHEVIFYYFILVIYVYVFFYYFFINFIFYYLVFIFIFFILEVIFTLCDRMLRLRLKLFFPFVLFI